MTTANAPIDYKARDAARAAAALSMRAAFPHLVPISDKVDSLQAAAKNIRIELARAFPGVKFSVKSRRFSGGDAVDVRWIDGPVRPQVDAIIGRYQSGTFDSMTDCAGSVRDAWTDAFGDARFVSASRNNSDKALASAARYAAKYWGFAEPTVAEVRNGSLWSQRIGNSDIQSLIYDEAHRRTWAITRGAK